MTRDDLLSLLAWGAFAVFVCIVALFPLSARADPPPDWGWQIFGESSCGQGQPCQQNIAEGVYWVKLMEGDGGGPVAFEGEVESSTGAVEALCNAVAGCTAFFWWKPRAPPEPEPDELSAWWVGSALFVFCLGWLAGWWQRITQQAVEIAT